MPHNLFLYRRVWSSPTPQVVNLEDSVSGVGSRPEQILTFKKPRPINAQSVCLPFEIQFGVRFGKCSHGNLSLVINQVSLVLALFLTQKNSVSEN